MEEYIREIEQIATRHTESQSDGYSQIMRICDTMKEQQKYCSGYTSDPLRMELEKYIHWQNTLKLVDWKGTDLTEMNLSRVNFSGMNMCSVNMSCSNLSYANMRGANLSKSFISGADLSWADLSETDLNRSDLSGSDLSESNLRGANLKEVNLSGANLSRANLSKANLSGADLSGANLYGADLDGANLKGANLSQTKNIPFIPYNCPDFGSFTGYTKVGEYIVELKILAEARRSSSTERKCRCDVAKITNIFYEDRSIADVDRVIDDKENEIVYKIGEVISINNFNPDRWDESGPGICFFINFQEAVEDRQ